MQMHAIAQSRPSGLFRAANLSTNSSLQAGVPVDRRRPSVHRRLTSEAGHVLFCARDGFESFAVTVLSSVGNDPYVKKEATHMKRSLSVVVAVVLLGAAGAAQAGVEPSPFQPAINRMHSIDLNLALNQKALDALVIAPSLPRAARFVLGDIRYNLAILDAQLADILAELPPYGELGESQKGVYLALENIRIGVLNMEDPLVNVLRRMDVEPSPFMGLLTAIGTRINDYYRVSCPTGEECSRP
jgi:hypothetical protein